MKIHVYRLAPDAVVGAGNNLNVQVANLRRLLGV